MRRSDRSEDAGVGSVGRVLASALRLRRREHRYRSRRQVSARSVAVIDPFVVKAMHRTNATIAFGGRKALMRINSGHAVLLMCSVCGSSIHCGIAGRMLSP